MADTNPRSTARIAGHPIHPMLIPFPVAFFVAAFAVDIVYIVNADVSWARAAMWLLGAGIVMALVAALAGLTDFLGDRRVRNIRAAWLHMVGNVALVLLQAVNFYIRDSQGADTAVVPAGVILSGLAVALLLFNGWKGWELVYLHRVAVADSTDKT